MTFAELVYNVIVPIVDRAIVPFIYTLAFVVFLYGIVRFFFSTSEENRKKGRDFALYGIIGFFVMFSVWGLVRLALSIVPFR